MSGHQFSFQQQNGEPNQALQRTASGFSLLSVQWNKWDSSMPNENYQSHLAYEKSDFNLSRKRKTSIRVSRRRRTSTNWIVEVRSRRTTSGLQITSTEPPSFSKKIATLYNPESSESLLCDSINSIDYILRKGRLNIHFLNSLQSAKQVEFNSANWLKNFDAFSAHRKRYVSNNYEKMAVAMGVEEEDFTIILKFFSRQLSLLVPKLSAGSIEQYKTIVKHIRECRFINIKTQGLNKILSIMPILSPRNIITGRLFSCRSNSIQMENNSEVYITCKREFAQRVSKSIVYMNVQSYLDRLKVDDVIKIDSGVRFKIKRIEDKILHCRVAVPGKLYSYSRVFLPPRFTNTENYITEEEYEDISYLRHTHSLGIVLPIVCNNYLQYYKSIIDTMETLDYDKNIMMVTISLQKYEEIYALDKNILKWLLSHFQGIIISVFDRPPLHKCEIKLSVAAKHLFEQFYEARKPIMLSGFFAHWCKTIDQNLIVANDSHKYIFFYPDKYLLGEQERNHIYLRAYENIIDEYNDALQRYAMEEIEKIPKLKCLLESESNILAKSVIQMSFQNNAAAIIVLSKSGRMAATLSHYRPKCPIIVLLDNSKLIQYYCSFHNVLVAYYTKAHCKSSQFHLFNSKKFLFGILNGIVCGILVLNSNIICVYRTKKDSSYPNKISTFVIENEIIEKFYESAIKDF